MSEAGGDCSHMRVEQEAETVRARRGRAFICYEQSNVLAAKAVFFFDRHTAREPWAVMRIIVKSPYGTRLI